MKQVLYIALLATALTFTGCKGYLDEDNKSNITSDKYYATAAGYNTLINATYSSLRTIYGVTPKIFLAGTDLYLDGRSRGHTESPLGMYKELNPTNGDVKDFYNNCFQGIGTANTALFYGQTTQKTSSLVSLMAEARFIRAFYYFHLVQQFGGVAIVEAMTDKPILEFPRNTEEEVYAFIIKELEDLKPKLTTRATGADYGRVDQRTVDHILAKVYLTRGYAKNTKTDFEKARDYALAAISGQHLTLSFGKAYEAKAFGYRNDEVIWSVIYSPISMENSSKGNTQQSHFGGYLDGSPAGNKATDGSLAPTLYAHYLFTKDIQDPNNDLRYNFTFMENIYDKSMCFYDKTEEELAATKIIAYYPAWWQPGFNTAEWIAKNPAQRKDTKIRKIESPGNPDTDLTTFQKVSSDFTLGSNSNYYYPTFRKFDCPGVTVFSTSSSYRDIDIARVNDTYLIAAEAYLQCGDNAKAAEYINEIRKRGISPSDIKRDATPDMVNIDFILDERARELIGHYDRWYDLKRTGKLIERTIKYNPELEYDRSRFKGLDGNDKLLRPIPQDAIDANKSEIKQNPGYL